MPRSDAICRPDEGWALPRLRPELIDRVQVPDELPDLGRAPVLQTDLEAGWIVELTTAAATAPAKERDTVVVVRDHRFELQLEATSGEFTDAREEPEDAHVPRVRAGELSGPTGEVPDRRFRECAADRVEVARLKSCE